MQVSGWIQGIVLKTESTGLAAVRHQRHILNFSHPNSFYEHTMLSHVSRSLHMLFPKPSPYSLGTLLPNLHSALSPSITFSTEPSLKLRSNLSVLPYESIHTCLQYSYRLKCN